MKKLLYISLAAVAMSLTACYGSNDNDSTQDEGVDTIEAPADEVAEIDSTQPQEVTGIVVDGARRSIDVKVGDETLNFELESGDEVYYEIGDTVTVRYYMTRNSGDSVVEVIDHQSR